MRVFDTVPFLDSEEVIQEYLKACLEDPNPAVFLSALGKVARAKGIHVVAKRAHLSRTSLYKALAPGAKPRYETIYRVIKALNIQLDVLHYTSSTE